MVYRSPHARAAGPPLRLRTPRRVRPDTKYMWNGCVLRPSRCPPVPVVAPVFLYFENVPVSTGTFNINDFETPGKKKPSGPSLKKTRDHNAWNSHEVALEVLFSFFRPGALSKRAIKRDLRPQYLPHLGFPMKISHSFEEISKV